MLAFVHMRKTAGSTLATILRQSFLSRHCDVRVRRERQAFDPIVDPDELRRLLFCYRNVKSIAGHGIVPFVNLEAVFPRIRYYTFLRKPLDRCASDYQFRVQRGGLTLPFEDWIKLPYARNHQARKLSANGRAETAIETLFSKIEFVGMTERFHESLVMFRHWSESTQQGLPSIDIRYRPKNVAKDNNIKKQLLENAKTRRQLSEANREDLELYSAAAELFARQRVAYGGGLDADVHGFEVANQPISQYPRQVFSMLKREVLYKPMAGPLSNLHNPEFGDLRRAG